MGNRHKSREFTLQVLYAVDISENPVRDVVSLFWETLTCPEEVRNFANQLVFGVHGKLAEIDRIIARYSEHWAIDRMTSVDRNILRMAVFELLFLPEIPHSVTINEAVEIGKKFGSEDSGAFVNGILDKIAKEIQETPEAIKTFFETPEPAIAEIVAESDTAGSYAEQAGINGNGAAAEPGDPEQDEALKRQKMRRAAIMKAASKKKLAVGAKITIRKGEGP